MLCLFVSVDQRGYAQDAVNYGLRLDGVDDHIDLQPLSDEIDWANLTLTFEAWVRIHPQPPEAPLEYPRVGILFGANGLDLNYASNALFLEYIYETGSLALTGDLGSLSAQVPLQIGTWYHLAITMAPQGQRLYVNGELAGYIAQPFSNPEPKYSLQLGMDMDGPKMERPGYSDYHISDFIAADLDEVRIWRSRRTQSEIQLNMWRTISAKHDDLLAYFTFDSAESSAFIQSHVGQQRYTAYGEPERVPVVLPWHEAPSMATLDAPVSSDQADLQELEEVSFVCPGMDVPVVRSGLLRLVVPEGVNEACAWIGHNGQPLLQRNLPFWRSAATRLVRSWYLYVPEAAGIDLLSLVVDSSLSDQIGPLEDLRLLVFSPQSNEPQIVRQAGRVMIPQRTEQGNAFQIDIGNLLAQSGNTQGIFYTFGTARPLTQRWWMYLLYAVVLIGVGAQWRVRRSARRARKLEAEVQHRTTEIEQQRAKLEHQTEQLAALSEVRITQFANLTHELRTPLTLISGPLSELLRAEDMPVHHRDTMQAMKKHSKRLQRLINQLMDLARFDAGIAEVDVRPHRLDALVQSVAQALAPMAEQANVSVHTDLEDNCWATCDADATEKILSNLLSNALKFTPPAGRVDLLVREDGPSGVEVLVADTGIGIPEQSWPQVFERFYQVNPTATRLQEGSGIGLALAKMLAEAQGGTLTITESNDAGSTFRLWLPAVAAGGTEGVPAIAQQLLEGDGMSEGIVQEPGDEAVSEHDIPLVLVVDDNADVRQFVSSVLHPAYRVQYAADGVEAFRVAKDILPDAILSDVMMPEMDGLALTRSLKSNPATAGIPVVLLTAKAAIQDEVEGLAAGAQDYIAKPFDPEVLRARLKAVLSVTDSTRRQLGETPTPHVAFPQDAWIQSVADVIEAKFADSAFNATALAEAQGLSRSQLTRKLREAGQPSPGQLIRRYRLDRAVQLLLNEMLTISEVAYAVGFNSLSYFSRAFAAEFGKSPSAYREQHSGKAG
ncbi:MAG: hypothetical protein RhofKO_38890 [Rhodothermales bacterium]